MTINIKGSPAGTINISGTGGQVKMFTVPVIPFDPMSLGGLKAWYKADGIVGVGNGGGVSTWVDSSGNGQDLSTGYGYPDPLYSTGDALLGGKPSVNFTFGAGCGTMRRPSPTGLPLGNDARTVYFAGYTTNSNQGPYQEIFGYGGTFAAERIAVFIQSSNISMEFGNFSAATGAVSSNTAFITAYAYTGIDISSVPFYLDNVGYNTAQTNTLATVPTEIMMAGIPGASTYSDFGGAIAEALVYDTAHSDSDRVLVTNYLASKYGITI